MFERFLNLFNLAGPHYRSDEDDFTRLLNTLKGVGFVKLRSQVRFPIYNKNTCLRNYTLQLFVMDLGLLLDSRYFFPCELFSLPNPKLQASTLFRQFFEFVPFRVSSDEIKYTFTLELEMCISVHESFGYAPDNFG